MPRQTSRNRRLAVADALHSAAIHLLRRLRQEDTETGIGPARLSALSVLVFGGPMRLSDLARIEQVKPPTMTKIIDGLEGEGLARRRVDAEDGRAVKLVATHRGNALLQEGRRRRVERLARGLQTLDEQDLEVLSLAAAIMERVG